jgi:hypothetical protein
VEALTLAVCDSGRLQAFAQSREPQPGGFGKPATPLSTCPSISELLFFVVHLPHNKNSSNEAFHFHHN